VGVRQRAEATEAEDNVVSTKREARIQPYISWTKQDARVHELCVLAIRREAHVQPQAMPKHEVCISLQECKTRVQPKVASECDLSEIRDSCPEVDSAKK